MSSRQVSESPRIPSSQLPEAEQTQEGQTGGQGCDSGYLGSTVKTFLIRCAGLVDAASIVIIDTCRGETNDDPNTDAIDRLREWDQANASKRKQGGILEFQADGGVQDDVSALSANTLEEMERLAKMMAERGLWQPTLVDGTSGPSPGQQLRPPSASKGITRSNIPLERSSSDADQSIGVATSGSSSVHKEGGSPKRKQGVERFTAYVELAQIS